MVKLNISSLRSEQIQSSLQYCAGGLSGQEKGKKNLCKNWIQPPTTKQKAGKCEFDSYRIQYEYPSNYIPRYE